MFDMDRKIVTVMFVHATTDFVHMHREQSFL